VKLLDPVDHFPKVAGLHRLTHLGKGQFQILQRHPALCHKSRRQSLQRPANMINVDDVGVAQAEHAGAAAVSLGYKPFGS